MNNVRPAAIAGSFYEADPALLQQSIDRLLSEATPREGQAAAVPKAIIAPHAGHIYSGPVAAEVYAKLKSARGRITRVVLLGPSHHVGFKGIAASTATAFETPLGQIPVDHAALSAVLALPDTGFLDTAHEKEHSLEVHLPFLQRVLGDFSLVPLVVGDAGKQQVADVLETLWGGDETLIVISTDLSHFHSYDEARTLDGDTSDKILRLQADLVGEEACGCRPVNGLLHLAAQKQLRIETAAVSNSGDTAGPRDRVVGYGAYELFEKAVLPVLQRQQIIQVARQAILHPLGGGQGSFNVDLKLFAGDLSRDGASFITLNMHGQLRGCIGSLEKHRPLILDVAHNAQAAAFKDPRFKPVTAAEYRDIELHASVLSEPQELGLLTRQALLDVIRPGTDGLILAENGRRATFLPSVWDQLPEPEAFLEQLRRKAGLDPAFTGTARIWRYTTEEFT